MEEKPSSLREFYNKYHELIMYCVFGVTTTIISWGSYWFFMKILPFNYDVSVTLFQKTLTFTLNIFVSNVASWIIAVIIAFVTNKVWVFESKSWEKKLVWKELWTFVGGRVLTGVIEWFSVPLLVSLGLNQTLFHTEGFPAKITVTVLVVVLNYVLSKFISFNSKTSPDGEDSKA